MKNKYIVEFVKQRLIENQRTTPTAHIIICDTEKEAFKICDSLIEDRETEYLSKTIKKIDYISIYTKENKTND